jgi:hypothetical protein
LTLKKFLKVLTDDGRYYAELVDNLAEIYYLTDSKPSVLIEVDKETYHLNFRSDLMPNVVAQISHDISKTGVSLVVGPAFAISQDKGVVYGNEAMGMHYINVFLALQSSQTKDDDDLKDALFVVKDPLPVCMLKKPSSKKTNKKYKKMWDE